MEIKAYNTETTYDLVLKKFEELRFASYDTIHNVHLLFNECDNDFTPPLSTRHDNMHADFADGSGSMQAYLYSLMTWPVLIAFINGKVAAVGFYQDKDDYTYLSLIVVGHSYRGLKLASRIYGYIESHAVNNTVRLRTSSENKTQLAILKKRGYELIETIENDRGNGVDTLRFIKHVDNK